MQLSSDISAIVTGGASGLGEATARMLADAGVKVGVPAGAGGRSKHEGRVVLQWEAIALQ